MYDLHNLGWHKLPASCVLLYAGKSWARPWNRFLPTADAGQDGAFSGTWKRQAKERLIGRFVIQCKFTSKRDANVRAADLADELRKARKLAKRGLCDTYVLMTNAGISGAAAVEIKAALKANGVKHTAILGGTWLCDQIRERKRLRMMVPRIYGLGDLSQILDDRAYRQPVPAPGFQRRGRRGRLILASHGHLGTLHCSVKPFAVNVIFSANGVTHSETSLFYFSPMLPGMGQSFPASPLR